MLENIILWHIIYCVNKSKIYWNSFKITTWAGTVVKKPKNVASTNFWLWSKTVYIL